MIKRVLLLAVLMAVLVVPGAAGDTLWFHDYCEDLSLISSVGGVGSVSSDGISLYASSYGTGTGWHGPRIEWDLDAGLADCDITWDVDHLGGSGGLFMYARNGTSNVFGVDLHDDRTRSICRVVASSAAGGVFYDDRSRSDFSGTVNMVREGSTVKLYLNGVYIGSRTCDKRLIDRVIVALYQDGSITPIATMRVNDVYVVGYAPSLSPPSPPVGDLYPCTINVYDADSRLPLSGSWDYYVVIQGADSVSGSGSGASAVVNLPATSILQPHRIRVTKEGYVQARQMPNSPAPAHNHPSSHGADEAEG